MATEAAIQLYRVSDPDGFTCAMLILEIPDLLPLHRNAKRCLRRNCAWWTLEQKARAVKLSRRRMFDRFTAFRWWLKGRLGL